MADLNLDEIKHHLDQLAQPPASGPNAFWQLRHDCDHAVGTARTLLAEVASLTTERDRLRDELDEVTAELDATQTQLHLAADAISEASLQRLAAEAERDAAQALLVEEQRGHEATREELAASKAARLLSILFGHHKGAPRPFALQRTAGHQLVALGAEFPDGAVALRLANDGGWNTYSEGGAGALAFAGIEVLWLSDELDPLAETEEQLGRGPGRIGAAEAGHRGSAGVAEVVGISAPGHRHVRSRERPRRCC